MGFRLVDQNQRSLADQFDQPRHREQDNLVAGTCLVKQLNCSVLEVVLRQVGKSFQSQRGEKRIAFQERAWQSAIAAFASCAGI